MTGFVVISLKPTHYRRLAWIYKHPSVFQAMQPCLGAQTEAGIVQCGLKLVEAKRPSARVH